MSQKTVEQRRKESPYWQILRKDKPSAIAIYLVLLSTTFMMITFLGLFNLESPFPYSTPQFWVVVIIVSTWWSYLAKYGPISVALFKAAMVATIPLMVGITVTAHLRGAKDIGPFLGMTGFCSILVAIAIWFYRKSVLRKQGPFR